MTPTEFEASLPKRAKVKMNQVPIDRLIPVFKNLKNLIDYYWDPDTNILYGQVVSDSYKGLGLENALILLPKYKLTKIEENR